MTAQQHDSVVLHNGNTYNIVGVLGGPLFSPDSMRIEPAEINSACWRGLICKYALLDRRLTVSGLELGLKSRINGKPLPEGMQVLGETVRVVDLQVLIDDEPVSFGMIAYEVEGMAIPVAFSGGLLLARDFIDDLYVHMGFHPAWKYTDVVEALFIEGSVKAIVDRSAAVAGLRTSILNGDLDDPDRGNGSLQAWIERTFTLDYSRSTAP